MNRFEQVHMAEIMVPRNTKEEGEGGCSPYIFSQATSWPSPKRFLVNSTNANYHGSFTA